MPNRFAYATILHMHEHNYTLEEVWATLMGLWGNVKKEWIANRINYSD